MTAPRRRTPWLAAACAMPILVAAWPAMAAPAQAQAQSATAPGALGDNSQPIQIQADSGIEWQQNTKLYIARGNAVATRGPTTVHADVLVAHYRDAKGTTSNTGGNAQIYRIDADGHVVLTRNGDTVVGDRGVYDVDQGVAVITGKALKMTTPTETVTARDSFDWYDQKQIAVARGDAVATRNGRTIRADVLTGYLSKTAPAAAPGRGPAGPAAAKRSPPEAGKPPAAEADSKLTRLDAEGHVVVTNGADVGQGKYAVYNAVTGIVTLIDNVVITRDKDVMRGQYAVMDLNTNVSRMMPRTAAMPGDHRVVGLFVRRDNGTGVPGTGHKAR